MKNPVRDVLVVAHGQPSQPESPEVWLRGFSIKVAAHLPGWKVRSATLAAPNALEEQVAKMPAGALVFPMFMSDGWFVSRVLPKRLNGAPLHILTSLGFLPGLPKIAADILNTSLKSNGWAPADAHIFLAAHGSARGPKAALAARRFIEHLQPLMPETPISVGFIEQTPFLVDAAQNLASKTLCLPFFALDGEHCRDDIPRALAQAKFNGEVLAPLGLATAIPTLVADSILSSKTL